MSNAATRTKLQTPKASTFTPAPKPGAKKQKEEPAPKLALTLDGKLVKGKPAPEPVRGNVKITIETEAAFAARDRYPTIPKPALAQLIFDADEIMAKTPKKDWTKEQHELVRKAATQTRALRSLGYTVDRPGAPTRTRGVLDTDRASAANVALREAFEAVMRKDKKLRTKQDRTAINMWRNRDRAIRIALGEPKPERVKKAKGSTTVRLYFPTAPAKDVCEVCKEKPVEIRKVDHSAGTHTDCCHGCALDTVWVDRVDAGHMVSLHRVRDGKVETPTQGTPAAGASLAIAATA